MGCQITGETNWRWTDNAIRYQSRARRALHGHPLGRPVNNGDYMARSTMIGDDGPNLLLHRPGDHLGADNMLRFYYPPKPEDCHDGMEPPVTLGPDGSYPVPKPGITKDIVFWNLCGPSLGAV